MPFDGSGNFQRVMNWVADAAAGIRIKSDRHDIEDNNFAAGLTNCLTKDGQSQPTANIPMNAKKLTNVGAPTAAGDAATKAYVDARVAYSEAISITGADAKGRITFSGTQSPDSDPNSRALGLSWTQADLFFGVRPGGVPLGGDVPRWVWNDNASGTGADKMTLTEDGLLTLNKVTSGTILSLISTEASASSGPNIATFRRNASAAVNDQLGCWVNYGRNAADADVMYTSIYNLIVDPTTNSVDGKMLLRVAVNNVMTTRITLDDVGTTISGKLLAGDLDMTNGKNIGNFVVERTDDTAAVGPYLILDRISTTPAINDPIGAIMFRGRDSTASGVDPNIGVHDYARFYVTILDPANNSEAGRAYLQVANGGGGYFTGVDIYGTAGDNRTVIANLRATSAELTAPIILASGSTVATLQMTDAGATVGPILILERISSSAAAGDVIGSLYFNGRDSGNTAQAYARILTIIDIATAGAEDGRLNFQVVKAGSMTSIFQITAEETIVSGYLRATGAFIGGATTYLATPIGTGAAGAIAFRPQGATSSTGQMTISGIGNVTIAADLVAGGTVTSDSYFASSDTLAILCTSAAGTVYLRPNGPSSTTGQMTVDGAGDIVAASDINAGDNINAGGGCHRDRLYCLRFNQRVEPYHAAIGHPRPFW